MFRQRSLNEYMIYDRCFGHHVCFLSLLHQLLLLLLMVMLSTDSLQIEHISCRCKAIHLVQHVKSTNHRVANYINQRGSAAQYTIVTVTRGQHDGSFSLSGSLPFWLINVCVCISQWRMANISTTTLQNWNPWTDCYNIWNRSLCPSDKAHHQILCKSVHGLLDKQLKLMLLWLLCRLYFYRWHPYRLDLTTSFGAWWFKIRSFT